MSDETVTVRAALTVLIEPVLQLIQDDPHQWSTRPCPTCRTITSIVGKPFGCVLYAQKGKETSHDR